MAIYKEFDIQPQNSAESGDVITNIKDVVSSGMWANGAGTMTSFFTSYGRNTSSLRLRRLCASLGTLRRR